MSILPDPPELKQTGNISYGLIVAIALIAGFIGTQIESFTDKTDSIEEIQQEYKEEIRVLRKQTNQRIEAIDMELREIIIEGQKRMIREQERNGEYIINRIEDLRDDINTRLDKNFTPRLDRLEDHNDKVEIDRRTSLNEYPEQPEIEMQPKGTR